jgi:hypothetical protein
MFRRLWILSLVALLAGNVARADTPYWRVTMDRVTVISNGSRDRCRRLATQLLVFERLLRDLAGAEADYQPPPITLYSLSGADADRILLSDAERRQQTSSRVRIYSKFLPGPESNLAAIANDGGSDDPLQSVLLLYGESQLQQGPTGRFPPWFQLGVANLMNGLVIRDDGSVLLNRNLPFEPVQARGAAPQHYDLLKLLQVKASDLNAAVDFKEFMKVAREWAQFGLLTTPPRRAQYRELATLMRQGAPAQDAVKDAFGAPFEQVAAEFQGGTWRNNAQYRLTPAGGPVSVPAPEKLDPGQASELLQQVADRVSAAAARR